NVEHVFRAYSAYFGHAPPSLACIENSNIGGALQIECTLVWRSEETDPHALVEERYQRKILHVQCLSEWAPANIGPYSQASAIHNVIRVTGQIALDPPTMSVDETSNLEEQLDRCIRSVHQILTA